MLRIESSLMDGTPSFEALQNGHDDDDKDCAPQRPPDYPNYRIRFLPAHHTSGFRVSFEFFAFFVWTMEPKVLYGSIHIH
jgi:hypothetical protein